jgi:hypothetical protein
MTSNILKYGAVDIDYNRLSYTFSFNKPSRMDIQENFKSFFKDTEHATVLLSGGLDSQFVANIVAKYVKSSSYVTFAYLWDGVVMNSDDIISAQRFAELLGVTTKIVDVELHEFLNDIPGLKKMGMEVGTSSPQLMSLMYAIRENMCDLKGTIVKGGERPGLYVDNENNISFLGMTSADPKMRQTEAMPTIQSTIHDHQTYSKYTLPFVRFSQQNEIDMICDMFLASPELFYLGYLQNNVMFEQDKFISESKYDYTTYSMYYEKVCYYKTFENFVYYFPLGKRTGFENLQHHLASHTGNYDEFDKRYRKPLNTIEQNKISIKRCIPRALGHHRELLKALQDSYDLHKPTTHTVLYNYTW